MPLDSIWKTFRWTARSRSLFLAGLLFCALPLMALQTGKKPASNASKPELVLQMGHERQAGSMAISADNRLLVSAESGTVKLWDLRKGELLHTFALDGSWPVSIGISPDGKTMAAFVGTRGQARLYDVTTGRLIRVLDHGSDATKLVFSPDGNTVALGDHFSGISLWNYRTGRRLRSLRAHGADSGSIDVLAFSQDGKRLASSASTGFSGEKLEIWNVATGELLGSIDAPEGIYSAAFSPDGKTMALGVGKWIGEKPVLELWDIAGNKIIKRLLGHKFEIISLSYSQDGRTLAAGDAQGILKLWDVETGQALHSVGRRDFVIKVAVSPDAGMGAEPGKDGSISVYNLNTGDLYRTLAGYPMDRGSIAYSGDGVTLFQAGQLKLDSKVNGVAAGQIASWDTRTGTWKGNYLSPDSDVTRVAANRDGTRAITAGYNTLQGWDLPNRRVRTILKDDKATFFSVALSPDGSLIAAGGQRKKAKTTEEKTGPARRRNPGDDHDALLELYDSRTGGLVRRFTGHTALVNSLQFTADGKTLMSCGYDNTVFLWNVTSGSVIRKFSVKGGNAPECAVISRDGRTVAIGYEYHDVRLYDALTGRVLRELSLPNQNTWGIGLSPDGRRITAGGDDGILRVWDVANGRLLHSMVAHTGSIQQVVFSAAGRTIASLDGHGTLRFWDPERGRLRATTALIFSPPVRPQEVDWLVYTPEGYYEGSPGAEKFIRWRVDGALFPAQDFKAKYRRPDLVQVALGGRPKPKKAAAVQQYDEALRAAFRHDVAAIKEPEPTRVTPPASANTPTERLREALSGRLRGDSEVIARVEARVKEQLKAGADPNTQGVWGTSPLMFFSATGNMAEVKKLFARKANVNLVDVYGGTALTDATRDGHDDIVKLLLENDAGLKDEAGGSLLLLRENRAALSAAMLRMLTRTGDSINQEDRKFKPFETAYILLTLGADPNARDKDGRTPLLLLADWALELPFVKALLTRGADPNAQDSRGTTVLQRTAQSGNIAVVQLLLSKGAKVNLADATGYTPLMGAAYAGHKEMVSLLLEHGANPDATLIDKNDGRGCLVFAISEGHLDIVRILLDHGANGNVSGGYDKWSPLTYAVMREDKEMVKLLLSKGADVKVSSSAGKTLLEVLRMRDAQDKFGIGPLLKAAGAP
jgi:WD40 repeat protein/ankyrin repeat protein